MTILAGVATGTTVLASLVMWTLLSAPAQVANAAADGAPELLRVLVSAIVDAALRLVAWL
jgi:hypothetical protein